MDDEHLQDCGIEELYARAPLFVPQTTPELSWQFLEQQPYGLAVWDIALVEGVRTIVFMAREPRADLEHLPKRLDAHWKAISLGMEIQGHRVMPIIVMIHFVALQTIYEVWFNFYGEAGEHVQEAFRLLAEQETIYLFFHDQGPEPVRKIGFDNSMRQFFRGHYGMLKAMPEWSDADFNAAKDRLMKQYSCDDLWGMK